jgi:hypothetical protein
MIWELNIAHRTVAQYFQTLFIFWAFIPLQSNIDAFSDTYNSTFLLPAFTECNWITSRLKLTTVFLHGSWCHRRVSR